MEGNYQDDVVYFYLALAISCTFLIALPYLQILAIGAALLMRLSMQVDQQQSSHTTSERDEPFRIQLTARQAQFLATFLPLRYSLQPERKKKGPKANKNPSKSNPRSNLPPTSPPKLPSRPPTNAPSLPISLPTPPKIIPPQLEPLQNSQQSEETTSTPRLAANPKKEERGVEDDWRLLFLRECRQVPLFMKAYSKVFQLLERKTRSREMVEGEFIQTVINVVNDEKMRRTQKGLQLSEQLKKVFMKHRYRTIAARKAKEEHPKNTTPTKPIHKDPPERQKEKGRSGSQSSDDLGVDFDLNQFEIVKPSLQCSDNQFMEAASISQGLRRLPGNEVSALLKKYSLPVIDVLKIKALSPQQLQSLREEVLEVENRHTQRKPQFSEQQSAESSFEVEED